MFWFEYKYMNSYEIFEKITHISNFWVLEMFITATWVFFIFFMVMFFIPNLELRAIKKKEEAEKRKKRLLIDKIVLQKNLEDVITMELESKSRS